MPNQRLIPRTYVAYAWTLWSPMVLPLGTVQCSTRAEARYAARLRWRAVPIQALRVSRASSTPPHLLVRALALDCATSRTADNATAADGID